MANSNFPAVMALIKQYEGGYVNDPKDPGGPTNLGITQATLSAARKTKASVADVKALTWAEAMTIYKTNYWDPIKGDYLPVGVDLAVMDPAVNSGISRGAKFLQTGLGFSKEQIDGYIGNGTLAAAKIADPATLVKAICASRMGFLHGLRTFTSFGKGWTARVANVEATGVHMALSAAHADPQVFATALAVHTDAVIADAKSSKQKALGVSVGSTGAVTVNTTTSLADQAHIPAVAWVFLALVAVVIVLEYVGRSRYASQKAKAYAALGTKAA